MFIREGLLDPLSSALINVTNGMGCDTAEEMKIKIIQIILIFSQVSQSDVYVRNAIGTRKVIRRECAPSWSLNTDPSVGLLRGCEILEPEYLPALLKAIKHLSMSQSLLDPLQNANAIEILIELLEKHHSCSPHYTVSLHDIYVGVVFYFHRRSHRITSSKHVITFADSTKAVRKKLRKPASSLA
jgi:hypothetical protein